MKIKNMLFSYLKKDMTISNPVRICLECGSFAVRNYKDEISCNDCGTKHFKN